MFFLFFSLCIARVNVSHDHRTKQLKQQKLQQQQRQCLQPSRQPQQQHLYRATPTHVLDPIKCATTRVQQVISVSVLRDIQD